MPACLCRTGSLYGELARFVLRLLGYKQHPPALQQKAPAGESTGKVWGEGCKERGDCSAKREVPVYMQAALPSCSPPTAYITGSVIAASAPTLPAMICWLKPCAVLCTPHPQCR